MRRSSSRKLKSRPCPTDENKENILYTDDPRLVPVFLDGLDSDRDESEYFSTYQTESNLDERLIKASEKSKRQPKKRTLRGRRDVDDEGCRLEPIRPKRVRKTQMSKKDVWIDDEFYEKNSDFSEYEIDSSDEIPIDSKPLKATSVDILNLFNNSSVGDFKSLINISPSKWEKLISLRPFLDYNDLVN